MDIILERILSLLPKKPNGKFEHGVLKDLGTYLGFTDGHIVNEWISGKSRSYRNYLYQIAEKYDVSVAWLKGETDEKKKPTTLNGSELKNEVAALLVDLATLRPEQLSRVKDFVAGLKASDAE